MIEEFECDPIEGVLSGATIPKERQRHVSMHPSKATQEKKKMS
jgi:hypothetical protein